MPSSGQLAVVTGASSGIGLELARILAEEGYDLIVTAEDSELEAAAAELAEHRAEVEAVRADLARAEGVEALYERIAARGRPVDVLVLNAGVGLGGDFVRDQELGRALEIVDLNVRSTVHLAKLVVSDMVERGHGRVLITSSVASTMPGAFQAVYNASKSFVQSFALAIREELADTEITITSLMPGPTETEFFERAELQDTKLGQSEKDDAAQVARQGYDALIAGEAKVIAGSLTNKLQGAVAGRLLPDGAKAKVHRRMAEPGSGES